MSKFAGKTRRSAPMKRRARLSRLRYRRSGAGAQQAEVRRILRSEGEQSKFSISHPSDTNEKEADRVANHMMDEQGSRYSSLPGPIALLGETKDDSGKDDRSLSIPSSAEKGIESSIDGGGHPLPGSTRVFFEKRFATDFSAVRIHSDHRAASLSKRIQAKAFTLGANIFFGAGQYTPKSSEGKKLLAHELTHVVQQNKKSGYSGGIGKGTVSNHVPQLMRKVTLWPGIHKGQVVRSKEPKVLRDFAKKFPAAANLVRKSPEAMKLVRKAAAKGAVFAGYPKGKQGIKKRAYSDRNKIYIPKSRTDKFLAMSDFVFELNNAMRTSQSDKIKKLGKKRRINAKQYAYRIVKLEIEAELSTGMIWSKMRQGGYKARKWSKYDKDFFLKSYKAYKAGKKTKHQIVKEALRRKYKTGLFKGRTVESFYMGQYQYL